jgi:Icc-related predicted phosphoesterase
MRSRQFWSIFVLISLLGTIILWYHLKKLDNDPNFGKEVVPNAEIVQTNRIRRVVCISDTHGKHRELSIPNGDILIHSGDFTHFGEGIDDFVRWFHDLPHRHKVIILGNHEAHNHPEVEEDQQIYRTAFANQTIHILQDEAITLEGIRFYGSSWQCQWDGTGFYRKRGGKRIREKWGMIPSNTQILITHSPSYGPLVDDDLFKRVLEVNPILHIFGHVHAGPHGNVYTTFRSDKSVLTTFIKASICDDDYKVVNKPVVIDIHV